MAYYLINFIKSYETEKLRQHPVGMTFQYGGDKHSGNNADLFSSRRIGPLQIRKGAIEIILQ